METKYIEIRDSATRIAAVAFWVQPSAEHNQSIEDKFLRCAGYGSNYGNVILMRLDSCRAKNDPYDWGSQSARTMPYAHQWILDHWDEIKSGQVVDVRVILGEASEAAEPEIWLGELE